MYRKSYEILLRIFQEKLSRILIISSSLVIVGGILLLTLNNLQQQSSDICNEKKEMVIHRNFDERCQSITNRTISFWEGENGSYIRDLSNSYICRITLETKNIESILTNDFVEVNNRNTVNTIRAWRVLSLKDTKLGDRNIPIKNIKYYYGATKDGKLKVGRLEDFEDENMVASPVWNKTDLVKSYHDKVFKNDNPESATLLTKPYYLTENKDTIRLPKSSASGKYYLISPNGNTLFMYRPLDETSSYFGFSYNKEQQRVINDFLKKNNGAYPVMVDNGMFEHFYTPERRPNGNMLENYIPNDFSANPNDMHILGETKNPNSAEK